MENKEKQLVSKMAQGTGTKKYHREYAGPLQYALSCKFTKKCWIIGP